CPRKRRSPIASREREIIEVALLPFGHDCCRNQERGVLNSDGARTDDCRVTAGIKQSHRKRVISTRQLRCVDLETEPGMRGVGEASPDGANIRTAEIVYSLAGFLSVYQHVQLNNADVVERPAASGRKIIERCLECRRLKHAKRSELIGGLDDNCQRARG